MTQKGFSGSIGGSGGGGTKPTIASLGEVLGFVTEFNANTQIFGLAALTVLAVMGQMQTTLNMVTKHESDIVILKDQTKRLWDAIYMMRGTQPGQADNPKITRPPNDGSLNLKPGQPG